MREFIYENNYSFIKNRLKEKNKNQELFIKQLYSFKKIVCFTPLRHLFFFKKVECPIIIDKNNFKKIMLIKRRLKKKNEIIYTNFLTANLNN